MAIAFTNFDKYLNSVIEAYVRDNPVGQTVTDKPLLRRLRQDKKMFVGGADFISGPARGKYLSDYADFGKWYSHLDEVSYAHSDDIERWKARWRELHMGAVFDFTEFKQRGVKVDMNGGTTMRGSAREVQIVQDWAKSELEDNFGESQSRLMNNAVWGDGVSVAGSIVGITGILDLDPSDGLILNLDRGDLTWWRHRVRVGGNKIVSNLATAAAITALRNEVRQQRLYGGLPNLAVSGSAALEKLEAEASQKVTINQDQFVTSNGKTAVGSPDLVLRGVGPIEWDPWLDQNGLADNIFVLDTRHLLLRPMEGEDGVVHKPERPYNQYVLLKGVTWTGALCFDQLNCHGRYQIA